MNEKKKTKQDCILFYRYFLGIVLQLYDEIV